MFGTHYLPGHFPTDYGIQTPMPATLTGQLLSPLAYRTSEGTRPIESPIA